MSAFSVQICPEKLNSFIPFIECTATHNVYFYFIKPKFRLITLYRALARPITTATAYPAYLKAFAFVGVPKYAYI